MNLNIIELLKPYDVNSPKKRLGPNCDGGYVISELALNKCTNLFTYGVDDDIKYEEDFAVTYGKPCFLFDHTINQNKWEKGLLTYIPEGLGYEHSCKDFLQHYDECGVSGDVLLKIDIEGNEYDYFDRTNILKISEVTTGIIIEVHYMDNPIILGRFIKLMNELNEFFLLNHVHDNNIGSTFNYHGFNIPNVMELSFINKKLVGDYTLDTRKYPISGVDYPNDPLRSELQLSFIN
jgi:hypothetical protein